MAVRMAAAAEKKVQGFFAVPCHFDRVGQFFLSQGVQGQLHIGRVVLDEQNFYLTVVHAAPPSVAGDATAL
jgi:hypothetical protein